MTHAEFSEGMALVQASKRDTFEDRFTDHLWSYFRHDSSQVWIAACVAVSTIRVYGKVEFAHFLEAVTKVRSDQAEERERKERQARFGKAAAIRDDALREAASKIGISVDEYVAKNQEDREAARVVEKVEDARRKLRAKTIKHAEAQGEDTSRRDAESEEDYLNRILDAARSRFGSAVKIIPKTAIPRPSDYDDVEAERIPF